MSKQQENKPTMKTVFCVSHFLLLIAHLLIICYQQTAHKNEFRNWVNILLFAPFARNKQTKTSLLSIPVALSLF